MYLSLIECQNRGICWWCFQRPARVNRTLGTGTLPETPPTCPTCKREQQRRRHKKADE